MNLDDCAVYVFVRQDLPEQDQKIQLMHAMMEMTMAYRPPFAKYRTVELDGGESEKAFRRTVRRLQEKGIVDELQDRANPGNVLSRGVCYFDPDHPEWGVTAIATVPLSKEESLPLANYRLRRNASVAQTVERAPSPEQGVECEVAGATPAGSSNL